MQHSPTMCLLVYCKSNKRPLNHIPLCACARSFQGMSCLLYVLGFLSIMTSQETPSISKHTCYTPWLCCLFATCPEVSRSSQNWGFWELNFKFRKLSSLCLSCWLFIHATGYIMKLYRAYRSGVFPTLESWLTKVPLGLPDVIPSEQRYLFQ